MTPSKKCEQRSNLGCDLDANGRFPFGADLDFKLDFIALTKLLSLDIGNMHKDAVLRIEVADKAEPLVIVEHGNDALANRILLDILLLCHRNFDVLEFDLFAFNILRRSGMDLTQFVNVTNHIGRIKRHLVLLRGRFLQLFLLALLVALCFSLPLPESLL